MNCLHGNKISFLTELKYARDLDRNLATPLSMYDKTNVLKNRVFLVLEFTLSKWSCKITDGGITRSKKFT